MTWQISRADRSVVAEWWFTIDRALLTGVFILLAVGIFVSLVASPSVASAKGLPDFYFVRRHLIFSILATGIILVVSLMSPRIIRRLALVIFVTGSVALGYIAIDGETLNGATRWLRFGGYSFQPSEVVKPAFAVLVGWAFGEMQTRPDVPALPVAIALYLVFAALLVIQPDIGQTALITLVWGALFVLAGMSLVLGAAFGVFVIVGGVLAYSSLGYVRKRVDVFLNGDVATNSQVGQAYKSFVEGGFFGRGPGEGTIKVALPDAHTDFIFAVVAEEYGVIACLGIVALFAFILFRALGRAVAEKDLTVRYGIVGLALLIGLQALINMGVNVGLLPAKGMTLPMISAGGSSVLGIALTLGMMLALTRDLPNGANRPTRRRRDHAGNLL